MLHINKQEMRQISFLTGTMKSARVLIPILQKKQNNPIQNPRRRKEKERRRKEKVVLVLLLLLLCSWFLYLQDLFPKFENNYMDRQIQKNNQIRKISEISVNMF